MTEQDILQLIQEDKWMMEVIHIAESIKLQNWAIGTGFIRNKIWDHLHGYTNIEVDTPDIDLVYFNPEGNDEESDQKISNILNKNTHINWEIVNEVYAHKWNNIEPYTSIEDAISKWPETVTSIGVTVEKSELKLIAPHGINDLVNLVIKPTPTFYNKTNIVRERVAKKKWLEKWPKLKLSLELNDAQDPVTSH